MSIIPSSLPIDSHLLSELALATADEAPAQSTALLALLDRPNPSVPALLGALTALRLRLLEAPGEEAAMLWEDLQAVGQQLRGPLVETVAAMPASAQERLIEYLRALSAGGSPAFAQLAVPLARSGLVLAVAGDFKRGKSTLLNALLGMRLLPTRVAPATAVPCLLRYAPALTVQVVYSDGRPPATVPAEDLERYACIGLPGEEDLVAFRAEVDRVEIGVPWDLPSDVTLMDLPGLNEEEGRADMAMAALDAADAVLVVLSATQLLAEDELLFLDRLWTGGYRTLLFPINYLDQLAEDDLPLVVERAARLLAPYGGTLGRNTFLVSARAALSPSEDGAPPPPESGLPALSDRLHTLLTGERERVWRLSRVRQVFAALEEADERAGRQVLDRHEDVRRLRAELADVDAALDAARRRYEEGEGTAHELALLRQRIMDHEQQYDGRWAALEAELRERCRRAPLPWVWQEAREWLRQELILAIREVLPGVTPRPEGHLRIRVPPGLRLGREALLEFYRAEAAREWERFTGTAQRAGRQELETALATAEREGGMRLAEHAAAVAGLEARRGELDPILAAAAPAIREALGAAISAAEALRAALTWPGSA